MPKFVDKPNETIKYIYSNHGNQASSARSSGQVMTRFKAQFNGMEHGAVRVRPKNGPRFIN